MTQLSRDGFIPKQYESIVRSKNSSAIVYLISGADTKSGNCSAKAFFGKAAKPAFYFSFRSEGKRAQYVAQWIADMDAREQRRAEIKTNRKAFSHTLKVGDILKTSWGYDQTNIEYFEVTELVAKTMVIVCEIAQESEETGFMCGKCVPVPGKFIGKPMRKRVLPGNILDIHNAHFGRAYPLEMKEVAPGVKVAQASYYSSYA
jgi:hypothetical protein